MAELLVRVVDKEQSGDPYVDVGRFRAGDVIALQDDGWGWTEAERTNLEWQIILVPGVPTSDLAMLLAPEVGDPKVNRMLRPRSHFVDLPGVSHPGRPDIGEPPVGGNEPIEVDYETLTAAIGLKPLADDPNVIGKNPNVIG